MENLEKNQLVDESQPVPYIVHEGSMARMERSNKRLLADDHQCSETYVKGVVYGFGDPLLLEAARLDAKNKIQKEKPSE